MNKILKRIAVVYKLIKEIKRQYPNIQIGKRVIQSMMYLLDRKLKLDLGFSMYHYGPQSAQVSHFLNLIEDRGIIDMQWSVENGYSISLKGNKKTSFIIKEFEENLDEKERIIIKEIAQKYGGLGPITLFIITTALFTKENFGVKNDTKLIDIVYSLRPGYPKDYIKRTLESASVISVGKRRGKYVQKKKMELY